MRSGCKNGSGEYPEGGIQNGSGRAGATKGGLDCANVHDEPPQERRGKASTWLEEGDSREATYIDRETLGTSPIEKMQ